jgi:hypothetical protein
MNTKNKTKTTERKRERCLDDIFLPEDLEMGQNKVPIMDSCTLQEAGSTNFPTNGYLSFDIRLI